MRVAAVVVTYNRAEVLRPCIEALQAQSRPVDEVIVVDNASADHTASVLDQSFPDVTVVRLPTNTGAAGGFAAGIESAVRSGHDWIWVLNDDDTPLPGALAVLLQALGSLPSKTGMLASGRLDEEGRPWAIGGTWHHRVRDVPNPGLTARPVALDVVTFGGTLLSAAMTHEIGLPRADLFMMCEDLDLCLRARSAGWLLYATPEVLVTALGMGGGTDAAAAWRSYYQTRNHALIVRSRRSAPEILWWIVRTSKFVVAAALRRDWTRVRLRLRGAVDGVRGVSGVTVQPGSI